MNAYFCCFWGIVYASLLEFFPKKRARNYTSFLHSVSCVVLTSFYKINYDILYNLSLGYFIYDTIFILLYSLKREQLYLYHHGVMFVVLKELHHKEQNILVSILKIGELSNFFTYIVYDMLKQNIVFYIEIVELIQLLWFGYFRIYISTILLFSKFNILKELLSFYPLLSLYSLGYIWTFGQFKKLIIYNEEIN